MAEPRRPNHFAIDLTASRLVRRYVLRRRRWRGKDTHRRRSEIVKTRLGTFGGSRGFCKQVGVSVFQYDIQPYSHVILVHSWG